MNACLAGLATQIIGHEVKTVPQAGWAGIKNGRLLKLAETDFDVFITADRNLSFQQDLARLAMAVIVLRSRSNRYADLLPLMPQVLHLLIDIRRGGLLVVGP